MTDENPRRGFSVPESDSESERRQSKSPSPHVGDFPASDPPPPIPRGEEEVFGDSESSSEDENGDEKVATRGRHGLTAEPSGRLEVPPLARWRRGIFGSRSPSSGRSASRSSSASGLSFPRPPRGRSPMFDEKDRYTSNPTFPSWNENVEYAPWSEEKDERLEHMLAGASVEEMFRIADQDSDLQHAILSSDAPVQAAFSRLMQFCKIAIEGKSEMMHALRGAHTRIRNQEVQLDVMREHVAAARGRHEILSKDVEGLERQIDYQEAQFTKLENEKAALAEETVVLKKRQQQARAEQESEIRALEQVVEQWEKVVGISIKQSLPGLGDRGDPLSRLQAIRAAIEEAAVRTARTEARCKHLEDEHTKLEVEYETLIVKAESAKTPAPSPVELGRRKAAEQRIQKLQNEVTAQMKRADAQAEQYAEAVAQLRMEKDKVVEQSQARIERFKREAASYKEKLLSLHGAVEGLKQKLSDQEVASAYETTEQKSNIQALSKCIYDIDSMISDVIGDFEAEPSPGSIRESFQKEAAIREKEAAQLETIRSGGAIIDKITAGIAEIERAYEQIGGVGRSSGRLSFFWNLLFRGPKKEKQAEGEETHGHDAEAQASEKATDARVESPGQPSPKAQEMGPLRQILEGVDKLKVEVNSLGKHYTQALQDGSDIQGHLDGLRETLRSQERAMFNIFERVQKELGQVGTATAAAQGEVTLLDPFEASWKEDRFGLNNVFIKSLEAVLELTSRVRFASADSEAVVLAIRQCIERLWPIIERLKLVEPDTPTQNAIVALRECLEKHLASGVGDDNQMEDDKRAEFFVEFAEHEMGIERLLEQERYAVQQLDLDRQLLESIQNKIDRLRKLQREQKPLLEEYEARRAELEQRRHSTRRTAEEAWALAGSFVDNWIRRTRGRQFTAAAAGNLANQIQELIADSRLTELRTELRKGVDQQNGVFPRLEQQMAEARQLADGLQAQGEALGRLSPDDQQKSKTELDFNDKFAAGVERREKRLRHEQRFFQACINQVRSRRDWVVNFVDSEADKVRREAEKLVAEGLLRTLGEARPGGQHGGPICFCTLLRFFLPRVYYRIIYSGCCAGEQAGRAPSRQSLASSSSSCRGHHGHGILAASGRVWTSLCHILTGLLWLGFILLLQPYNIITAASFFGSLLLGLPRYSIHIASFAHAYTSFHTHRLLHDHRLRQRFRRLRSILPVHNPQPSSTQPQQPSSSTTTTTSSSTNLLPPPSPNPSPPPPPPLSSLLQALTPQLPPVPLPSDMVGAVLCALAALFAVSYLALLVERSVWLGGNSDWRHAYLADLLGGGAGEERLPYSRWGPFRMDYRLLWQPVWSGLSEGAHNILFGEVGGRGFLRGVGK